jgi:hypothetical protein
MAKILGGFDFQLDLDRTLVAERSTLRVVEDRRNALLLGPPGVGKTHRVGDRGHRGQLRQLLHQAPSRALRSASSLERGADRPGRAGALSPPDRPRDWLEPRDGVPATSSIHTWQLDAVSSRLYPHADLDMVTWKLSESRILG